MILECGEIVKHGRLTAYLGKRLAYTYPRDGKIFALYDHGEPDDPAVSAIRLYLRGFPFDNQSVLADMDIMIAEGNKAIILIEIEETTITPKQVVGDIFAPFFAESLVFKSNEEYKIDKTCLIIGLLTNPAGNAAIKTDRLVNTIRELQQSLKKISFSFSIDKIHLVCEAEDEELVKAVEEQVKHCLR